MHSTWHSCLHWDAPIPLFIFYIYIPQQTRVNWSVWTFPMGIATQKRPVVQRMSLPQQARWLTMPLRDSQEATGMNCRVAWKRKPHLQQTHTSAHWHTSVCVHSIQSLRSWWTSQWSQCRGVCGQGKQVRAVFCLARDSSIINDNYCSAPKPQQARHCSVTEECLYSWKADEWGNVSFTQQYNIAWCATHYCFKGVLYILVF